MSRDKASQRINGGANTESRKNRKSPLMIIIVVVAALAVVVGIGIAIFAGKKIEPNVVVTPDNVEDIIAEAKSKEEERVPVGSYELNMNYNWSFDNAKAASSNAYVGNSANNNNTVYFTVTLEGSEDVIYKSPFIPVGSHMENITLDSNLGAGVHNAVVKYHLVDEAYKDISSVSVAVTITIKN